MWPFKKKSDVIVYNDQDKESDSYLGAVLNAVSTMSRRFSSNALFGISPDGKRNYNQIFGYGTYLSYSDYYGMYKRGGIAGAVVSKLPKACWREVPKIFDGENEILKDQLKSLKRMGFFRALERADILNRIGSFSIMLIGVPDGEDLDKPVGSAKRDFFEGMYFNVYGYDGIEILKTDDDPASRRFGLPVLYQLQVIDVDGSIRKQTKLTSLVVHHSRVVHMAEGSLDSSIEGMSALEQPWNALTDKEKVRGSSSEAYYRNSRQKLSLETKDGAKPIENKDTLKQNVEDWQNGFDDTLRLNNMTANMLQPSIASPRDPFDVCVEEVSGTTGIPVRILTTKAGGSVTGSEDKATWNALIQDRQDQECSIYLLDALSVMSEAGMLDLPLTAEVVWPVQSSLGEKEKSESTKNKADAFRAVVDGLTTVGADDVEARSVFETVGLSGVELDDLDISADDKKLDEV